MATKTTQLEPITLTIPEVRAWIEGHGMAYTEVCEKMGVNRWDLNMLMRGSVKFRRGKGHHMACALRLKPAPPEFKDFVLPPVGKVRRWLTENQIAPIPHPRTLEKHYEARP